MRISDWSSDVCSSDLPLLEGVVVSGAGAPEGGLEVGAGVGAAEEVAARADLAQRVHRLAVLAEVVAGAEGLHQAELVGVDDELLVGRHQAALQPAGRVEHEVHADRKSTRPNSS